MRLCLIVTFVALFADAAETGQKFDLKGIEEYIKWRKRETQVFVAANHARFLHSLSPLEELAWHMPKELLLRQEQGSSSSLHEGSASESESDEEREEGDQDGSGLVEDFATDGEKPDLGHERDDLERFLYESTDLSDSEQSDQDDQLYSELEIDYEDSPDSDD